MDILVIVIIALVLFCMFGVPLIRTERRRIKDSRSEEMKVRAKVLSKRIGSENVGAGMHYLRDGGTVHHATFSLIGGEEMEFDISRSAYGQLNENTWGELTYQGKRFLSFTPLPDLNKD